MEKHSKSSSLEGSVISKRQENKNRMKEVKGLDIGCLVTLWREEVLWRGKELWQEVIHIILIVYWALFCFITTIPFHIYH